MEENNTKEINLLQLIGSVVDWLKKMTVAIIYGIGNVLKLSYRYKIIVISFILVFLGIGLYFSRPSARIYSAEANAMIYGTDVQTAMEVTKQLEVYALPNGKSSLTEKLQLPDSIINNVVAVKTFYILCYRKDGIQVKVDYENVNPQKDTMIVKMGDRMCIQVLTKNTKQLPKVQDAILKYLNNNPVMRLQFETKRIALSQQIDICKRENTRIDSLAKVSYFKESEKQIQMANNSLLVGEQKKQLFYNELLDLHGNEANAEYALINHTNPIVLPAGFSVAPKPLNPMSKYSVIGIIMGYLLSLVLIFIIDNVKSIKNFFK